MSRGVSTNHLGKVLDVSERGLHSLSQLTWEFWPTSRNSPVLAFAVMAVRE